MAFRTIRSLIFRSNIKSIFPATTRVPCRTFHRSIPYSSGGIVQHRDTPENNDDTPFEWTEESKSRIETILKKFPKNRKKSGIIHCLFVAQEQNDNWLPLNAMKKVAKLLDVPPMQVYEVATFYTMFNRNPAGKYHIQYCGTTPCQICGSEAIKEAMLNYMGVHEGEVTEDGYFSLTEVECLGACVNAPMVQVNNQEVYENLTPESAVKLLKDFKEGNPMKVGPQTDQINCQGPLGRTTLLDDELPEPVCRDLDALKKEIDDEQKQAQDS